MPKEYQFKNDKIKLLEESKHDNEKMMMNAEVNIRMLNRMLINPNKQGTADIARQIAYYEEKKNELIKGAEMMNEIILELYEKKNKTGKGD